mmetsp:Transcript_32130/g.50149  ORF Transcript_32130/g.50149 Transcript_32130/m.50149 type:complete len:208 (+) Transcript_32130:1278-1901(+)
MAQLKELKQSVPWSSDSSSCAEGKLMYNSFEKAQQHAKTEEASLVGIWQINRSVNRTFDNGGHWCVLTTDHCVKLELKFGDGESASIRLYGIDLVHPDLKVEAQISSDDPNYHKALETMVDMKTSYQVGQDQSVLATTKGKQVLAAYRRFHQQSLSTSPAKSSPTPGGGCRRSPSQTARSPAKRLRSTRSSASKHPTEFVYAGFCVS